MSMNFYIEILSFRVPPLPGRENKRGDLWRHNDVLLLQRARNGQFIRSF